MNCRANRRQKLTEILLAITITIALLLSNGALLRADIEQPEVKLPALDEVNCLAYCVYDKTADEIILSKNPFDKVYPASMTKIMTASLAFDYLDTSATLTASANAMNSISADSTVMGVCIGETTTVSEFLYGLMLPSGNDAANVLAEGVIDAFFKNYPSDSLVAGPDGINAKYFEDYFQMTSQEILNEFKLSAFALLMNYRAERIGLENTHFVNAHGLHDDEHYTTASDLTKIMAFACENPDFCKLIHTPTHYFAGTNVHQEDGWSIVSNSNKILADPWLIAKTSEGYDTHAVCMVGGKTGSTSLAGTGMTTYSVNENGHELFISVCGIPMDQYAYQTRYVASIVAYGNLECWQRNPETVVPGKLGDYQGTNITENERAEYDPLFLPGDSTTMKELPSQEEVTEEDVEEPTPAEKGEANITITADDDDEENDKDDTKLPKVLAWAKDNKLIASIIAGLTVIIIVLIVVIIARIGSKPKRKKRNKNAVRRPYIGEYIREMPDSKDLKNK